MDILIGADPELFVKKDGVFQSAFGLINGTKVAPLPVEKGGLQVDGMALEFNIDPAASFEEFDGNINTVLRHLRGMVPSEYEFAFTSTASFPAAVMDSQPFEALRLGCDPDFNAYTMEPNPMPEPLPGVRTAGGHVHVGWCEGADPQDPGHFADCARLARQLDWFLGMPSMLVDNDAQRRLMYGKAGCFRAKPYGMEYRTLSNFWVENSHLRRRVFNGVHAAMDCLVNDRNDLFEKHGNYAQDAIDTNNVSKATMALGVYNGVVDWR